MEYDYSRTLTKIPGDFSRSFEAGGKNGYYDPLRRGGAPSRHNR